MALLSYRPSLDAITDKKNLLSNDHIEIKNSLLEACRKYGSKTLNNDFLSLENSKSNLEKLAFVYFKIFFYNNYRKYNSKHHFIQN
jgi:hypothetical protein